jgi:hypothetical protein
VTGCEVRCHASDADFEGHQQSCGAMAWALIPWVSAEGEKLTVPLCFNHMMRMLQEQQGAER